MLALRESGAAETIIEFRAGRDGLMLLLNNGMVSQERFYQEPLKRDAITKDTKPFIRRPK